MILFQKFPLKFQLIIIFTSASEVLSCLVVSMKCLIASCIWSGYVSYEWNGAVDKGSYLSLAYVKVMCHVLDYREGILNIAIVKQSIHTYSIKWDVSFPSFYQIIICINLQSENSIPIPVTMSEVSFSTNSREKQGKCFCSKVTDTSIFIAYTVKHGFLICH